MALTEKQIEVAAQWWADQVCAPKFDAQTDEDRKEHRYPALDLAELLAAGFAGGVSDNQREKFVEALKDELHKVGGGEYFNLSVDYGPDRILSEAARVAGVSSMGFPWKTSMYFRNGGVQAARGYGSVAVDIMTEGE